MTQDVVVVQARGNCTCCDEPGCSISLELPGRTYFFCIGCADAVGWELMLASRDEQFKLDVAELEASRGVTA